MMLRGRRRPSQRLSYLAVFLAVCLAPVAFAAQTPPEGPPAPESKAREIPPRKTFEVRRASAPIRIDGALDDAAWSEATRVDLPYEYFPGDNVTPPVRTDCFVTFDETNIYVAF